MRSVYIILYLMALVITGAAADGLNNSGVQTWGHLLEALEILFVFGFVMVFKLFTWREFAWGLGSYICIRVFGFDYMYNLVAGNELTYMGGSNWWDMFWSKQNPGGVLFGKVIFLIAGCAFPFNHLWK